MFDLVAAMERRRHAYITANDGQHGKQDERKHHDPRTLVRLSVAVRGHGRSLRDRVLAADRQGMGVSGVLGQARSAARLWFMGSVLHGDRAAIFIEERHEQQAEHVKAGHEGRDDAEQPQYPASVRA